MATIVYWPPFILPNVKYPLTSEVTVVIVPKAPPKGVVISDVMLESSTASDPKSTEESDD